MIVDVQNEFFDNDNGIHLIKTLELISRLKELISILRQGMRIFWTCRYI